MKKIFALAMTLLSLSSFAQTTDSVDIRVVYPQKPKDPNVAFFINGRLMPNMDLAALSAESLNSVEVIKKDTTLNGHTYDARILITTKSDFAPSFISLNELKRKYTNLKAGPSIFMIDDRVISNNYDEIMVDEKTILQIVVDKISNPEEKLDVNVIKLLTKSEVNIKKSKEIILRGNSAVEPAGNYFDNNFSIEQKKIMKGRTL